MTLDDVKREIRECLYVEDDAMIEVLLASVIANRMKIGDPVWMLLIGASSGGKSQLLRPFAMTDPAFFHRIDDLTENTFLSGGQAKGGKDVSLLTRIGPHGIISISDLTVLFSKNSEAKGMILAQFRMLYDGEMTKNVGNKDKPLTWRGYLGIMAGGTSNIYLGFEEVADMGERFLCYRMHPYNEKEATRQALRRSMNSRQIDERLSVVIAEYIKEKVREWDGKDLPTITPIQMDEIIDIAMLAERVRTTVRVDRYSKSIEHIPTPAMPMRTALQLSHIARAMMMMNGGELTERMLNIVSWIGMSLANDDKRTVLSVLSEYSGVVTTQEVGERIGLDTSVAKNILQGLATTGVVVKTSKPGKTVHEWRIADDYIIRVRGIFGTVGVKSAKTAKDVEEEIIEAEVF